MYAKLMQTTALHKHRQFTIWT